MSWRSIWALGLCAAGLLIVSMVRGGCEGDESPNIQARGRVFPGLSAGGVRQILIQKGARGSTIRVERRGEGWRMTAPVEDRADAAAVERLLGAAEFLEPTRVLGSTPVDGAGLTPPSVKLTLVDASRRHHLELGARAPGGQGVYARGWTGEAPGDAATMVCPGELLELLRGAPTSLRDRQLVPLYSARISSITIHDSAGSWSVSRAKKGWHVERDGARTRGRELAVRRLLAALLALRAATLEGPAPAGTAVSQWISVMGAGERSVKLSRAGACPGRADRALLLAVEAPAARRTWACVDRADTAALTPAPGALRDLKLTRLQVADLGKVLVHMETRTALLERGPDGWSLTAEQGGTPVPSKVVDGLVGGLAGIQGELAGDAGRGLQRAVVTLEREAGPKEIFTFWDIRGGGLMVKRASSDGAWLRVPDRALALIQAALDAIGR